MKTSEIQRDHQRLLSNLRLVQKQYTIARLANVPDISKATWLNRMKEPWRMFSYDDFKIVADYCKIDIVTLMHGELKLQ